MTKRQLEVLMQMRDQNEELVYSKGVGYVGLNRVSATTVLGLLQVAAIRMDRFSRIGGDCERYTINETGRKILEALQTARSRKPFAGGNKKEVN